MIATDEIIYGTKMPTDKDLEYWIPLIPDAINMVCQMEHEKLLREFEDVYDRVRSQGRRSVATTSCQQMIYNLREKAKRI